MATFCYVPYVFLYRYILYVFIIVWPFIFLVCINGRQFNANSETKWATGKNLYAFKCVVKIYVLKYLYI